MKIEFENKFLEKLKERKEENITISLKGNPSCKGFEFNPAVGIYPPKAEKIEDYSLYKVEGINVYIEKIIEKENIQKVQIRHNVFGLTENYFADFE